MLQTPRRTLTALALTALVTAAACGGGGGDEPARTGLPIERQTTTSTEAGETGTGAPADPAAEHRLAILEPEDGAEIPGNVVTLLPEVSGVEIVPAGQPADEGQGDDEATATLTGHYHVFIDRDPTPVGQPIPTGQPDIVHTAEDPIILTGLGVGEHRIVLTVGDATHVRISEELTAEVTVEVTGPAVTATAPATVPAGQPVTIEMDVEGVEIAPAAEGRGAHIHLFVDTDVTPLDQPIPTGRPDIVHTTETTLQLTDLEPGDHVVWIVLGDSSHVALDPPGMARVAFRVE